jgi:signal transduction histidine kinase
MVMGMADWLRRTLKQKGLDGEGRSADSLLRNAKRMKSMIDELVESARLEAGRLEMHIEPTDLAHLIYDIAERVGVPEERARIRVEIPEYVPPAMADPAYVERAIVNLITNGLKYSAEDAPVIVRARQSDGTAVVSVTDQGIGIAQEEMDQLFKRYYRSGATKSREGLGLGLYITRLIVEAHGGRIWVESTPGKGSTFYFTLPLAHG